MTGLTTPIPGPRALIVDLSTRFGGSDARVLGLLAGMPPGSAALAVLDGAPVGQAARDVGIPTYTVGRSKADPRIVARLVRRIRAGRYEVVDTQNPQSRLWGSLAARLAGVALVSTLNSWYEAEHEGRLKGRAYQALERVMPAPETYIAVAPDIGQRLLDRGMAPERVALIPNTVHVDPAAVPADRGAARSAFGAPDDAIVAVALGRLVEAKGYEVLIDATALLVERHPTFHALIIGEGHLRGPLERRVRDHGLSRRVILPGFRPPSDLPAIMQAADLFVMPSRTEGTPLALLEAAALGLPIVASAVGGIPDLVTDGGEALLVPPGDPRALADAMACLIDDPERGQALGRAARQRVMDLGGRERQVADTIAAYGDSVKRCRRLRSP